MKSILSGILPVLLLLFPAVVRAQFNYVINANLTITITSYSGPGGTVTIPDRINNLPVVSIGNSTFAQSGITNIVVPSGVTNIQSDAFANCTSLLAINVDVNNPSYGSIDGVLTDKIKNSLIKFPIGRTGGYTVPNTVSSIGSRAFVFCSLATVAIPNSVTNIGDTAFGLSFGLTNVTMGNGIRTIEYLAFGRCGLTEVTIPSNVVSIGPYTFNGCTSLSNVTMTNGLLSIGPSAFVDCSNLKNILIPNGVTNIGESAFRNCTSLTNFSIPPTVSSLADGLFATCSSLKSIVISNGITSIGYVTFSDCTNLSEVTIPNSVSYIGPYAFSGCTSLNTMLIPDGVTFIDGGSFQGCSGLTNVTIGKDLVYIGGGAFGDCYSLVSVYFQGNAPGVGLDGCFGNDFHSILYYVPGTTGWGTTFSGRPVLPGSTQIRMGGANFGVQTNQFGFYITGNYGLTVVVEAATNLANPIWTPLATNTLTSGWFLFSDPQWTNFPGRFYRIHSQ